MMTTMMTASLARLGARSSACAVSATAILQRTGAALSSSTASRLAGAASGGSGSGSGSGSESRGPGAAGAWPSRKKEGATKKSQKQGAQGRHGHSHQGVLRATASLKPQTMPSPDEQLSDVVRNILQGQGQSKPSSIKGQLAQELKQVESQLRAMQQQKEAQDAAKDRRTEAGQPQSSAEQNSNLSEAIRRRPAPGTSKPEIFSATHGDIDENTAFPDEYVSSVRITNGINRNTDIEDLKVCLCAARL